MIRINLLPREEREKRTFGERPRAVSIFSNSFLVVSIFLVCAGTAMQVDKGRRISEALGDLERNVEMRKRSSSEILNNEREISKLRVYFARLDELREDRDLPVRIMEELSRKLPKDLWYTSVFQSGPAEMTIEGVSFSNLRVAQLMMGIQSSQVFRSVRLVYSEKGTVSGRDVVKFKLLAAVKGGGAEETGATHGRPGKSSVRKRSAG